jgi:hypothetical protein
MRTADGRLAYLDFGMVGEVDARIRRGLVRATLHLVNREYSALADDFVTLGMLPKSADKAAVVPALTRVFADALRNGVNGLSFGELSGDLGRTMYQFNFQIPSYYTLLVRSLSVLEGIALASDKEYKVLGAAYPWVARRLLTDASPELRSTLLELLYKDGRFDFRRMEGLLTQASRALGRPARRGGDAAPRGDALALLLSPQGEFVRGIVVEELAKGADAAWRLAADGALEGTRGQVLAALAWEPGAAAAGLPPPPPGAGPLLRAVMDVLAAAPRLADQEDRYQVEGLRSLAAALQRATQAQRAAEEARARGGGAVAAGGRASSTWVQDAGAAGGGGSAGAGSSSSGSSRRSSQGAAAPPQQDAVAAVLETLEAAGALLQWALKEAETLGPEERAEALRLPLEIAQAVASRLAARAVRWALVGDPLVRRPTGSPPPPPSSSSSASAAAAAAAGAPPPPAPLPLPLPRLPRLGRRAAREELRRARRARGARARLGRRGPRRRAR